MSAVLVALPSGREVQAPRLPRRLAAPEAKVATTTASYATDYGILPSKPLYRLSKLNGAWEILDPKNSLVLTFAKDCTVEGARFTMEALEAQVRGAVVKAFDEGWEDGYEAGRAEPTWREVLDRA